MDKKAGMSITKKNTEVMCEGVLCYLKPEAKRVYSQLTEQCQVDPDLAMAIMENICKEDELFDLGEGESCE